MCVIAPARVPARWISLTWRRRLNQEKNFSIATNPPLDLGSLRTPSDATCRLLGRTVVRVALPGNLCVPPAAGFPHKGRERETLHSEGLHSANRRGPRPLQICAQQQFTQCQFAHGL